MYSPNLWRIILGLLIHSHNQECTPSSCPSVLNQSCLTPCLRWDLPGVPGDNPTVLSFLLLGSFYPLCLSWHSSSSGLWDGKSSRGGNSVFWAQLPSRRVVLGSSWLLVLRFPHLWQEELKTRSSHAPLCFSRSVLPVPPQKAHFHGFLIFSSSSHSGFWGPFQLFQGN